MKTLTVDQISTDRVTFLANKYWSPDTEDSHKPYDADVIDDIYETEILITDFSSRRIVVLELSQYLENYVWPNYSSAATKAHLVTVVVLINEKFRERVPPWVSFESVPAHFPHFFRHLTHGLLDESGNHTVKEQMHMTMFLNHLYNSIESDLIRTEIANTVSYNILESISEGQLQKTLQRFPTWSKALKRTARHKSKLQGEKLDDFIFNTKFLYNLMNLFLKRLSDIKSGTVVSNDLVQYCERILELVIDLESQLPTRRYFNALLESCNLVVKAEISPLTKMKEGKLFLQLLYILQIYAHFEINENTGMPLTERDAMQKHYGDLEQLQKLVFKHFPDHREICFSSMAALGSGKNLLKLLEKFSQDDILRLCNLLHTIPDEETSTGKDFLQAVLVYKFEKRQSQLEAINIMPLYPTEEIIWDDNIVPSEYYSGNACLALPKLNLQFLTLHDYLLRNFDLFRLESTYEIRQDIEDIVLRLNPWEAETKKVLFRGWARMAHPITTFAVCEVAKPDIGEDKPSRVRADVTVILDVRPVIRGEWEALRKHDVCLLISIMKPKVAPNVKGYFPGEYGIRYVRGCEIEGMLDDNGRVIEEGPEPKPALKGITRTFRVWLDPNQYKIDMDNTHNNKCADIYETFNIIMKRKPKENNFKAVLETIRDLMNTKCVVPDWLLDIILGYGDPEAAHYSKMGNSLKVLDFNDTFINFDHLKQSFPDHEVSCDLEASIEPPFRLRFESDDDDCKVDKEAKKTITVEQYVVPNRGPYPYTVPRQNSIRFTPTQIEAIRSGMQPGLTMVVGPPGTGKTDVAVQIISNIYHNNPQERTLIVTHSNQALNQLFEKIMALDVDERHLLRLGHGEEALETEKDFSRYGRVNYVLNKRLELLSEVTRLKNSLGVMGEMGASCETAGYFFLQHILSRWEKYLSQVQTLDGEDLNIKDVSEYFPFNVFFANAPQPLFKGKSYEEDIEIAKGCFRYLENIFTQLKEFRAFEMLRGGLDRTKYLLVKEAKIIAMTCTHAALKRHELVCLGFQFDNILMEESAQILEIETFIPLLLQNPEDGRNRLKRWVMIGDHHQLPPVIKNMAFQKFSNMEQSLFTRFVRLGTPTIDLDAQGRARPSICSLYNWRYKNLGNLQHVISMPEFQIANAGLAFNYQLVNVDELEGKGETEPRRYFYQNLAEAEYAVHLYMYMRLLGYPANSISLLTTYNGQKELLRDVIEQRCASNSLFGRPHKISTVDKYQGQQNDHIILSLVRTKAVGHIRDVRRLVVAMSRARLGLYIFAKVSLFKNCFELQPAFSKLTKRPLKLHLLPHERAPCSRKYNEAPLSKPVIIDDVIHMSSLVHGMYTDACAYYHYVGQQEKSRTPGEMKVKEVPEDTGARYDSDEEQTIIINEIDAKKA